MKKATFCVLALLAGIALSLSAAPGAPDLTFAGTGFIRFGFEFADDFAHAVAQQPDGKIVVAGYTTTALGFNGSQLALARYTTNNLLDPSFGNAGRVIAQITDNTNVFVTADALAVQPDGKIVVAGSLAPSPGMLSSALLVRFAPDGSMDTSFGQNGWATNFFGAGGAANAVALQPDGKIIIGGIAYNNGNGDFALARYTTNGVLDPSFNGTGTIIAFANGDAEVRALKLQSDGKLLVAGDGGFDFALFRYNTNGVLDTTFGPNHDGKVFTHIPSTFTEFSGATSIAIEPGDGINTLDRIVLGGLSQAFNPSQFVAMRYNMADGSLDSSFGGTGVVHIPVGVGAFSGANAVVVQGTNSGPRKIILAGNEEESDGATHFGVVRLNDNGSLDNSFDGDGRAYTLFADRDDEANAALLVPGDDLLVVGTTRVNEDNHDFALARYHLADGSLDNNFNRTGKLAEDMGERDSQAKALAIQPDGKMVVAGTANNGPGSSAVLTRLNTDGSLDMSFGNFGKVKLTVGSRDASLNAVAIQPDNKIVAAGFEETNFLIVRYTSDGFLDPTFNGNGIVTDSLAANGNAANAIALQPDGKIVIAGDTGFGSQFAVLRYTTNGTLDTTFNGTGTFAIDFGSGLNQANAVQIQPDGKIVVAGYAVMGGTAVDMVGIRLLTNGVGDSSFGIFGEVAAQIGSPGCLGNALAIQPDGKILIAGYSANSGAVDFALVRYTTNGAPDASFNDNGQVVTSISLGQDLGMAVGLQRDGKILLAGSATILGHPQYVAVRYNTNGSLDAAYGLNGFGFVDFRDGGDNHLNALAIDAAGRVIVAGQAAGLFGIARLQADPHLEILSLNRVANGHIVLSGTGSPGTTHTILVSPTPASAGFNPIGQVTTDNAGRWQYEDTQTMALPSRFYRLSLP